MTTTTTTEGKTMTQQAAEKCLDMMLDSPVPVISEVATGVVSLLKQQAQRIEELQAELQTITTATTTEASTMTKPRTFKRQRTLEVNGETITIKSNPKYWRRNFNGFEVEVNGEKFHASTIDQDEAEDHGFVRWMKNNH